MRTKQPPQQSSTGDEIWVDSISGLENKCLTALRSVLPQKHLYFTDVSSKNGSSTVKVLGDKLASTSAEAKYKYTVIPLPSLAPKSYWLTVSLEFEIVKLHNNALRSGSIFVFEGDPADPIKKPLIRAEWSCLPGDMSGRHAQPHWHIYPSQVDRPPQRYEDTIAEPQVENFGVEAEENNATIQDFNPIRQPKEYASLDEVSDDLAESEWNNSARFHFAMASRWHDETSSTNRLNEQPKVDQLPKWLSGCIAYTLNQLKYINEKDSRSFKKSSTH
jgi:hypothetical protein